MPKDRSQLVNLLTSLTDCNNEVRSQAEAEFNSVKKNDPIVFFSSLVELFCFHEEQMPVQMAGILVKKTIRDKELFEAIATQMAPETLEGIQQSLLSRLGDVHLSYTVRRLAANIIVVLVCKLTTFQQQQRQSTTNNNNTPDTCWPNLWNSLLEVAANETMMPALRGMCLTIYGESTQSLIQYHDFQQSLKPFENVVAQILQSATKDAKLAAQATEAISEFITGYCANLSASFPIPYRRNFDLRLAPLVVSAFESCCNQPNNGEVTNQFVEAIKGIVDEVNETGIDFFKDTKCLPQLLETLFSIASNIIEEDVDVCERNCQLLLELAKHSKNLVKSNKEFVAKLFRFFSDVMINGIREIDIENFGNEPEFDAEYCNNADDNELRLFEIGAQSLDALCLTVRGKQFDNLIAPAVTKAVSSGDWCQVAAAIGILTYCFEGVKKTLKPHLDMLMKTLIVPSLTHENAFVRKQALICCGQFSKDDCPGFQQKYFGVLLPLICGDKLLLNENECHQNVATAALVLVSCFGALDEEFGGEDGEEEVKNTLEKTSWVDPFFPPLLNCLGQQLSNYKRLPPFVVHALLKALSAIVALAKIRIREFAQPVLPFLQQIVGHFHQVFSHQSSSENNNNYINVSIGERMQTDADFRRVVLCLCVAIETSTLTFSYLQNTDENLTSSCRELAMFLINLLENSNIRMHDLLLQYILRGLTCISDFLKEGVMPILPCFLPRLLDLASKDNFVEVVSVSADEVLEELEQEEEFHEEYGKIKRVRVESGGTNDNRFIKVPTDLIVVKDLAATIILALADILHGLLYDHVPQLTQLAASLVRFDYNTETRETGAELISSILTRVISNKCRSSEQQQQLSPETLTTARETVAAQILIPLVEQLETEATSSVISEIFNALQHCIQNLPDRMINDVFGGQKQLLVEQILSVCDAVRADVLGEIEDARNDLGIEEEDAEDDIIDEDVICQFEDETETARKCLFEMTEVIDALLKRFKSSEMTATFLNSNFGADMRSGIDTTTEIFKNYGRHRQQQRSSRSRLPLDANPVLCAPSCMFYFSLIGTFVRQTDSLLLVQSYQEFLQHAFISLKVSLPFIESVRIAQSAFWSLSEILLVFATLRAKGDAPQSFINHSKTVVISALELLEPLLLAPNYKFDEEDAADQDAFLAVITNTVSAFISALRFLDYAEISDTKIVFKLKKMAEKVVEKLLPLQGDNTESNNKVYPHLIAWAFSGDHPLFGKQSGTSLHSNLVRALSSFSGEGSLLMNEENQKLMSRFLGSYSNNNQ